jgi:sterol O-acyltransferase
MARLSSADTPTVATSRSSSIDKVPQLVGQLNSDGTASLEADTAYTFPNSSNPPRSLKAALDSVADSRRDSSRDTTSEFSSEEDYDALKHDPEAIIAGGKGGGFIAETNGKTLATDKNNSYEEIKVPSRSRSRPGPTRLKSIPVTLNKLKEKGRYILTADDDALREILRIGMERVIPLQFRITITTHTY